MIKKIKKIFLTQGKVTVIDEDDFALISRYKWCYSHCWGKNGYAVTSLYPVDGYHPVRLYLHRLILGAEKGTLIDHINQNTLDNRRINLRFANRSINTKNSRKNNPNKLFIDK